MFMIPKYINVTLVQWVKSSACLSLKLQVSLECAHFKCIILSIKLLKSFQRTEKTYGNMSMCTFLPLSYLKYVTGNAN